MAVHRKWHIGHSHFSILVLTKLILKFTPTLLVSFLWFLERRDLIPFHSITQYKHKAPSIHSEVMKQYGELNWAACSGTQHTLIREPLLEKSSKT